MRSRVLTLAAVLAFPLAAFVACDSATEPFGPDPADLVPSHAISDGAHDGLAGFYFLPPMVKAPTYGGTFDPNLSPGGGDLREHGVRRRASRDFLHDAGGGLGGGPCRRE
jgi:hypothetical protein